MKESTNIEELLTKAYNKALRFLSYRPRSEKEVSNFLLKKRLQEQVVLAVIKKLKEQNLINDEEFVKWWIEQRQEHRGASKLLIRRELFTKRINPSIIDAFLEKSKDDYETALDILNKKGRRFERYLGEEYMRRISAFLQRRGFNWETIKKILDSQRKKE